MKRSALCFGLMASLAFAAPVFAIGSDSLRGFEAVAVRGMQELSAENEVIKADATTLRAQLERQHAKWEAGLDAQNAALPAQVEALLARVTSLESSSTSLQSGRAP